MKEKSIVTSLAESITKISLENCINNYYDINGNINVDLLVDSHLISSINYHSSNENTKKLIKDIQNGIDTTKILQKEFNEHNGEVSKEFGTVYFASCATEGYLKAKKREKIISSLSFDEQISYYSESHTEKLNKIDHLDKTTSENIILGNIDDKIEENSIVLVTVREKPDIQILLKVIGLLRNRKDSVLLIMIPCKLSKELTEQSFDVIIENKSTKVFISKKHREIIDGSQEVEDDDF